ELIGCVERPHSYYAMYDDLRTPPQFKKGDGIEGIPHPQIFHPWYDPSAPGYPAKLTPWHPSQAYSPDASTYNEAKFYWWLVHDPRIAINPTQTSGYDTYEEYRADDTLAA